MFPVSGFILLWLLSLPLLDAGEKRGIPNGVRTKDYPETVYLSMDSLGSCTGTAVGPKTIITAAHCFYFGGKKSEDPRKIVIYSARGIELAQGESFNIHPDFVFPSPKIIEEKKLQGKDAKNIAIASFISFYRSAGHDLAVLQVSVELKHFIGIVAYSDRKEILGREIRLVGFGDNNNFKKVGAGIKRTGKNTLVASFEGLDLFVGRFSEGLLGFADGNRAGVGHGDSGSGVYIDNRLAGVNTMMTQYSVVNTNFLRRVLGEAEQKIFDRGGYEPQNGVYGAASLSDPRNRDFIRKHVPKETWSR